MRLKESEILAMFSELYEESKPLSIRIDREKIGRLDARFDDVAVLKLNDTYECPVVIEVVGVPNPKNLQTKAMLLKQNANEYSKDCLVPIIVAPYIGEKQRKILDEQKLSWIDLCGNMKIEIQDKVYIEKTGNKNEYPDKAPIKKIFQGTSSLVIRALLLKPEGFKSQYEIVDFINNRNGEITTSTVSRVVKKLYEEILVEKTKNKIKAKNPESLLDELLKSYVPLSKSKSIKYVIDNEEEYFKVIRFNVEYLACGIYAAKLKKLAMTDQIIIVVKNINEFKRYNERNYPQWQLKSDYEYGNISIIENNEPGIWFNMQIEEANGIVDDIELYLELMNDKPRGPKIAEQLKENILGKFKDE